MLGFEATYQNPILGGKMGEKVVRKANLRKGGVFVACIALLFSMVFGLQIAQASSVLQANHLLISEVLYDTPGSDSVEEWIEIYNPTDASVDLSNYKLGDEETAGGTEGMYQFPEGTQIAPQGKLTVAINATGFNALYGKNPDFEVTESVEEVPNVIKYADWSSGNMSLSNAGDEVVLLGQDDQAVDVLTYEDGVYLGVTPHLGVSTGSSLERKPQGQDTNDCSIDFIEQEQPNPETGETQEEPAPRIELLIPQDGSVLAGTWNAEVQTSTCPTGCKVVFYLKPLNYPDLKFFGIATSQEGNVWRREVDTSIFPNGPCKVGAWIEYQDASGETKYAVTESVNCIVEAPVEITHLSVRPNPYNPTLGNAFIEYRISRGATVSVKIYDQTGNLIRNLLDTQHSYKTYQTINWDGTDDLGQLVQTGTYTIKMAASDNMYSAEAEVTILVTR